jgi:ubiquinone/menaquinone biosynthesis C-methylase UbiE
MSKSEVIARQSAHPTGLLGQLVARIMALDTWGVNRRVLQVLEPKPGERILELGCGHGRALGRIAQQISSGVAVGVDPSSVMRDVASRHLRRAIRAGRARVENGDSSSIPEHTGSFDKLFSVHTLYFWRDLDAGLQEIRRVLRPGGQVLLAFHSKENAKVAAKLPASVYTLRSGAEVADALRGAGFAQVSVSEDPGTQLNLAQARA